MKISNRLHVFICALFIFSSFSSMPTHAKAANSSLIVSNTIPSIMSTNATYYVKIVVKNTGSKTWTKAGGYQLKALGESDPFAQYKAYTLTVSDSIKPGQTKTFTIAMKAPDKAGSYTTDWRMYKGSFAFGQKFIKKINITSKVLQSITATTTKPNYAIGTLLDLSTIKVSGIYTDGTTSPISITSSNISGFDSSKAVSGQILLISVGNKTTELSINIVEKKLLSIAVTTPPSKVKYAIGESLDLTGLVVSGTYNDGTIIPLMVKPSDIVGFDNTKESQNITCTIMLEGKTTAFQVTITAISYNPVVVGAPVFSDHNTVMTVTFSEDMDSSTAFNVDNYKVESKSIFSKAIFFNNAKTVCLTVIPGSILLTGDYTVTISGIKNKSGKLFVIPSTQIIKISENTKPYIVNAKLTDLNKITVTFSEAIIKDDANPTATDFSTGDIELYKNGIKMILGGPSPEIANESIDASKRIVTIVLSNNITSLSDNYQVKLKNATLVDSSGNLVVANVPVSVLFGS